MDAISSYFCKIFLLLRKMKFLLRILLKFTKSFEKKLTLLLKVPATYNELLGQVGQGVVFTLSYLG